MAFIASALGPRVAAACAHASLGSLSMESGKEGHAGGMITLIIANLLSAFDFSY